MKIHGGDILFKLNKRTIISKIIINIYWENNIFLFYQLIIKILELL